MVSFPSVVCCLNSKRKKAKKKPTHRSLVLALSSLPSLRSTELRHGLRLPEGILLLLVLARRGRGSGRGALLAGEGGELRLWVFLVFGREKEVESEKTQEELEIDQLSCSFFFYLQRSHRRGVDACACGRRRRSLVCRLLLLAGGQARAIAAAARRGRRGSVVTAVVVAGHQKEFFFQSLLSRALAALFVMVRTQAPQLCSVLSPALKGGLRAEEKKRWKRERESALGLDDRNDSEPTLDDAVSLSKKKTKPPQLYDDDNTPGPISIQARENEESSIRVYSI